MKNCNRIAIMIIAFIILLLPISANAESQSILLQEQHVSSIENNDSDDSTNTGIEEQSEKILMQKNTLQHTVQDDVFINEAENDSSIEEVDLPKSSYDNKKEILSVKCNSDYGYRDIVNNIKSDAMKSLYEEIDAVEYNFFQSEIDLESDNNYLSIMMNDSLNEDQVLQVYTLYKNDHPLYYWLGNTVSFSGEYVHFSVFDEYLKAKDRDVAYSHIINSIDQYEAYCEGSNSNYTVAASVAYYMAQHIDYAYDSQGRPEDASWAHCIMGVFDDHSLAVCEGYAKAYQLLLNYFGIQNVLVVGSASGNVNPGTEMVLHAWNLVQMDDSEYYWVDPTWSDIDLRLNFGEFGVGDGYDVEQIEDPRNIKDLPYRMTYTYFMRGSDFLESHFPFTSDNTGFEYQYKLPISAEKNYSPEGIGELPPEWCSFFDGNTVNGSRDWILAENEEYYFIVMQNDGLHRQVEIKSYPKEYGELKDLYLPSQIEYQGITYDVAGIDLQCVFRYHTNATIAEGVRYIRGLTLYEPSNTKSITLPSTIEYIAVPYMSHTCIDEIIVSEDNPYISSQDGVLYNKDKTTLIRYPYSKRDSSFTVPDSVTNIYHDAFRYNRYLENITLGNNIKIINVYAFGGMMSLKEIRIPSSVEQLPRMVFVDNNALETISVSANTRFTQETFSDCSAELDIDEGNPCGCTYDGAFYMKENAGYILCSFPVGRSAKTVTVKPDCISILGGAFGYSGEIETVIIPDNCKVLEGAFNCSKVESLSVSAANESLIYNNGAILSPDGKSLYTYLGGCKNEIFSVPDSVETIEYRAFDGNEYIKRIEMNDNVLDVQAYAFQNCSSLESIDLSDSINWSSDINDYSHFYRGIFQGCASLKSISLPKATTHIPYYMFSGCKSLETVIIQENVKTVGDCAFLTDGAIRDFIVYSKELKPAADTSWERILPVIPGAWSVQEDSNYQINDGDITNVYAYPDSCIRQYLTNDSDTEYTIAYRNIEQNTSDQPDQGKCGDNLFWAISKDGKVLTISGSGEMYNYVLSNACESPWMWEYGDLIEKIIIEEGVTSIGEFAFYGLTSLKQVSIPESLSTFGRWSLSSCGSIKTLIIPSDVAFIDNYAFAFCDNLQEIIFEGTVGEMRGCLMGCSNLQNVVFSKNVSWLRDITFGGCRSLIELDFSNVIRFGYKVCPACPLLRTIRLAKAKEIEDYSFEDVEADIYYEDTLNRKLVGKNYGGILNWIDLHEHELQLIGAQQPTCTEAGNIEYWTCSKCGRIYSDANAEHEIEAADTVVKAKGHKEVVLEAIAATCTEKGLTEGKKCSACGEIFVAQEETSALGHDYKTVEGTTVAATCETAGREADKKCSRCDSTITGKTIKATGHDWTDGRITKEPAAGKEGEMTYTCSICGQTYGELIPALAEEQAEAYEAVDAAEAATNQAQQKAESIDANSSEQALADADKLVSDTASEASAAVEAAEAAAQKAAAEYGEGSEASVYAKAKLDQAKQIYAKAMITAVAVKAVAAEAAVQKAENAQSSAAAAAVKPGEEAVKAAQEAEVAAKDYLEKATAAKETADAALEAVVEAGYTEDSEEYKSAAKAVTAAETAKASAETKLAEATAAVTAAEEAKAEEETKEIVDLPKVTISKVVAGKKSATVKWKKVSKKSQKKISTIQIQYSTDKKFKKSVKTTTAKKTAVSKKISKLKKGKRYYFRIRSYKKISGRVHVSKWSSVKNTKAK